jgi:hypothetical protein
MPKWLFRAAVGASPLGDIRFDRAALTRAFDALGRLAWAEGATVEIAVYGGSALMMVYDWRVATKDVDAVFEDDRVVVRRLAAAVADQHGWPADWLNDGVKGFLSARDDEQGMKLLSGEFPSSDQPGLRVFVPRPEYLFAMKCRAMRLAGVDQNADVDDIRHLAEELGLRSAEDAIAIVSSFYPQSQLQPKVRFGIEEIFSTIPDRGTTQP